MPQPVPGKQAPLFAVCYDVSDDRERRRVDKVLTGFGFRVQKSVFECRLTAAALRQMHQALDRLNLSSGHVRVYRVYGAHARPPTGQTPPSVDDGHAYVIQMPDKPGRA